MKISLCLSGQPRFVQEVAPYIIQNCCNGYDVDVFAHLWFDEDLQTKPYKFEGQWQSQRLRSTAVDEVLKIYNPVSYIVEPSKKFIDPTIHFETSLKKYWTWGEPGQEFRDRIINNTISYYYSLNQVNNLKKAYEYANGFKYDWVVRCRTDTILHTKINYEQYDQNVINFSNISNQPDGMINDWFDFGGSKVMDAFMGVFPMFDFAIEKCMNENNNAFCPELIHRKMIDFFDIEISSHPIIITLPRF
jgi:hypothetical protein